MHTYYTVFCARWIVFSDIENSRCRKKSDPPSVENGIKDSLMFNIKIILVLMFLHVRFSRIQMS